MSKSEIEKVVRRHVELLDGQRWDEVLAQVDPECRAYVGGHTLDRDAWLGFGQSFYAAFPDARHEVHEILVDGDTAAVRYTFRGTHRGPFQGIPPTGREVAMPAIGIHKVRDGRVVAHWGQFDAIGLMQQLGAMPGA